jgi:hypothetical protein
MTDEIDEAVYRRVVLKMRGEEIDEERPTQRSYGFHDPQRFARWAAQRAEAAKADAAKANPEPKPAPATDWAAVDEKIGKAIEAEHELVGEKVGDALEQISNMIAGELDKESAARAKLEDRVREIEIRSAQQDVEIGRRDVTLSRQAVEIAELERRIANGDRRGGVVDATPSLKTIN